MKRLSLLTCVVFSACATAHPNMNQITQRAPTGVELRGMVVGTDGVPFPGAKVTIESACEGSHVQIVQHVLTQKDGSFSGKSSDPTCGTYRFLAGDRPHFWLPVGNDVFQLKPNGSIPTVSLSPGIIPEPVIIVLEQRGGEVEFRVFDRATTSYVEAGLGISRSHVEGHTFGAMSIATGADGSSHTLFLPPGNYEVTIFSFQCGTKTYFTRDPKKTLVTVIEGQRVAHTIEIDVSEMDVKESYNNPDGKKCVLQAP